MHVAEFEQQLCALAAQPAQAELQSDSFATAANATKCSLLPRQLAVDRERWNQRILAPVLGCRQPVERIGLSARPIGIHRQRPVETGRCRFQAKPEQRD